jgi:hypothetical protein
MFSDTVHAHSLPAYDPLSSILFYDQFDRGLHGWTALIGNYEDSLDSILPPYRDLRPPMLSNASTWDTGTGGALSGTYAMKLATRPQPQSLAVAVKRLTFRRATRLRLETYFTFKPEASQLRLSETDVHSIGVLFDLQNDQERVMPHLQYLNAVEGIAQGRWQYKRQSPTFHDIGGTGKTVSHFHLAEEGWEDVPNGQQLLCYNEIATKKNWHYLRVGFDLSTMSFSEFQCNDHHFDTAQITPMRMPAMANLWCMLNVVFFARAGCAQRTFLYLDSAVLSADLPDGELA